MADGKLAAKMYAKFVAGIGRVAGGDTPNWASLPIEQREVWMGIEDLARGELAPSWSLEAQVTPGAVLGGGDRRGALIIMNKTDAPLAVSGTEIDGQTTVMIKPATSARVLDAITHHAIVEMTNVLIDALGPHAVTLGEWLEDADRFELWHSTSGDEVSRQEQDKRLESIALAYGYLNAMATVERVSIAALIERHRIEAES